MSINWWGKLKVHFIIFISSVVLNIHSTKCAIYLWFKWKGLFFSTPCTCIHKTYTYEIQKQREKVKLRNCWLNFSNVLNVNLKGNFSRQRCQNFIRLNLILKNSYKRSYKVKNPTMTLGSIPRGKWFWLDFNLQLLLFIQVLCVNN